MSSRFAILGPVFALATWTACMLLMVATRRVLAATAGGVSPREYALGESAAVPAPVSLPNRNYMNLLELPVLFYVACLMAQITSAVSPAMVTLAWVYVGLRVVHSLVHITYNHVMHRFAAFAASNAALVMLWVLLARALIGMDRA